MMTTKTLDSRLAKLETADDGETEIIRLRPDGTATAARLRWYGPPEVRGVGAAEAARLVVGAVRIVRSFGGQP